MKNLIDFIVKKANLPIEHVTLQPPPPLHMKYTMYIARGRPAGLSTIAYGAHDFQAIWGVGGLEI